MAEREGRESSEPRHEETRSQTPAGHVSQPLMAAVAAEDEVRGKLGDEDYEEIRRAIGRGAPTLLLGTSTRSLQRNLAKLRAVDQRGLHLRAESEQRARAEKAAADAKAEKRVEEALRGSEEAPEDGSSRDDGSAGEDDDAWVPPDELRRLDDPERPVSTAEVFPVGCYLEPDSVKLVMEDKLTGKQVYQCRVLDLNQALKGRPHETVVMILANQKPSPPTGQPFEQVEFDNLQVIPYVTDRSPMRIRYSLRATGIRAAAVPDVKDLDAIKPAIVLDPIKPVIESAAEVLPKDEAERLAATYREARREVRRKTEPGLVRRDTKQTDPISAQQDKTIKWLETLALTIAGTAGGNELPGAIHVLINVLHSKSHP
jgi:hypothetical protein